VPLREQGLIRHIGLTGHNAFDQMYKMIATGNFDSVLIEYGYFRKGYNTRHSEIQLEWRENCIAKAHELGMGIVAMKVLGAWIFNHNAKNVVADYEPGAVKRLPAAAIRWVLHDPRVCVLNIGVSYPGDIDENIKIVTDDTTLTNEDRLLLADFSTKAYLDSRVQEMPVV
jgi:predicted aldo/keto reductase-like oxidoreductase